MEFRKPILAATLLLLFVLPTLWASTGTQVVQNSIYLKHTRLCVCGDGCDTNLLRLILPLLSKHGSVEVDSRKMLVTVIDEKPRVAKVLKLIRCYDSSGLPTEKRKNECS